MAAVPAAANVHLLRQLMDVIRQLSPAVYCAPGESLLGSGVGGHVRHIVDHYRLLLAGLSNGRVDYAQRERDARLEQDPDYALVQLQRLASDLQALREPGVDAAIEIQSACDSDGQRNWCRSTVKRELDFLAMHDVHHHALVAFMLRSLQVAMPDGFGIAPATRRYLETRA